MKKFAFFLMFLILMNFVSGVECQDRTDVEDIPCNVITPILNIGTTTCNASVLDINTPSVNYTTPLTNNSDFTYNFTFNMSNPSIYSITMDCLNYSATINLGHWDEDYNDKWLYFYGFSLLLGFGLFGFGWKTKNNLLCLLGGLMFLAFTLVFINQGYPTLSSHDTMRKSIILISAGIGLYIVGQSAIHIAMEGL